MKILEISRSYYPSVGGLEVFLENRFKIYDKLNYDYQLITTKYSTGKFNYGKGTRNVIYLKQYTPYNIAPAIKKYLTDGFDLISVNQVGRFMSDAAINHYYNKIPVLLTPHFTFHTGRYSFLKKVHSRFILKSILNKVDLIVAFTDVEKKYWVNQFSVPEKKIKVIPHYINKINEKSGPVLSDENYLLYLGRYDLNKRIDLLLESFITNKELKTNLVLTINKNDLPADLLKRIGDDKRIYFAGYVDEFEKRNLLRKCSALIYPSSFEAFGYSLLEASAFSKPILCSNLNVFQEILREDGSLKFENDAADITRVIEDFLSLSPERKKEMGEVNLLNLSRFNFENSSELYRNLFEELLNRPLR